MKRREFIRAGAGGLAIAAGGTIVSRLAQAAELPEPWTLPAGTAESAVLEALPGKLPLIKRSFRPPNFETPIELLQRSRSRRTTRSSCATTWLAFPEVECRRRGG